MSSGLFLPITRALILIALVGSLRLAPASDLTEQVKAVTPANIELTSVEEEEADTVLIKGKASENADIAAYLRVLDTEFGLPDLESIQRKDNVSNFVITLKK